MGLGTGERGAFSKYRSRLHLQTNDLEASQQGKRQNCYKYDQKHVKHDQIFNILKPMNITMSICLGRLCLFE